MEEEINKKCRISVDYEKYAKLERVETDYEELLKQKEELEQRYRIQCDTMEKEMDKYISLLKKALDLIHLNEIKADFYSDIFENLIQEVVEDIEEVV